MTTPSLSSSVLADQSGSLEAAVSYALTSLFEQHAGADPSTVEEEILDRANTAFSPLWRSLPAQQKQAILEATADPTIDAPTKFNEVLRLRSLRASHAARQAVSSADFNDLVAQIARPAKHILDPACGLGGTLAAVAGPHTEMLRGYDPAARAAAVAQIRLFLQGFTDADIRVQDALTADLGSAWDLVVAHPPLNSRLTEEQVRPDIARSLLEGDRGTVDGNAAWLSLVADAVAEDGQAMIVASPASVADRRQIHVIRTRLVEEGRVEAVLAIPAGMLPGTDSVAFLWVLSGKADARKDGQVLLLDARYPEVGAAARAWVDDATVPDLGPEIARIMPGKELLKRGFAPQLHLDTPHIQDAPRPRAPGTLLTSLEIANFKSVSGDLRVPLRPLTLVAGKNSAGKSSLIQALLLLQQSVDVGKFAAAGESADLGSLQGLLHRHDLARTLRAGFTYAASPSIDSQWSIPNPALLRTFSADFAVDPDLDNLRAITLGIGEDTFTFTRTAAGFALPAASFKRAVQLVSKPDATFPPSSALAASDLETFLAFSEVAYPQITFSTDGLLVGPVSRRFREEIEYRSSGAAFAGSTGVAVSRVETLFGALSDEVRTLLDRTAYLGPFRRAPERFSRHAGTRSAHDTPFFLLEHASERDEVSDALERLGVPYRLDVVNPVADEERSVLGEVATVMLTDTRSGVRVTPADVGFGISQVLPIVTELFARTDSIIMVEQPEIHLHPAMQAELADLFIESVDPHLRGNQVIAETHSEMLIMRLQRRIREQVISASDVLVLYVDQSGDGRGSVRELRLNEEGEFLDSWPGGFFDEQFTELFGDF